MEVSAQAFESKNKQIIHIVFLSNLQCVKELNLIDVGI